jgi:hypothetical protein
VQAIPGFDGYYATPDGQILSTRSGAVRQLAQRLHKGYWHSVVRHGVGRATARKEPVHRLVLLAFKGRPSFAASVCRHLDGNSLNNHVENLVWGTAKENTRDSIRHGTAACLRHGERHIAAKLSDVEVSAIRVLSGKGVSRSAISKVFGVTPTHVRDIALGRTRAGGAV